MFSCDEIRTAIAVDYIGETTDAVTALIARALEVEPDEAHAFCVTAAQYEAMATLARRFRAGAWIHQHDIGAEWFPKNVHGADYSVSEAELEALRHIGDGS